MIELRGVSRHRCPAGLSVITQDADEANGVLGGRLVLDQRGQNGAHKARYSDQTLRQLSRHGLAFSHRKTVTPRLENENPTGAHMFLEPQAECFPASNISPVRSSN